MRQSPGLARLLAAQTISPLGDAMVAAKALPSGSTFRFPEAADDHRPPPTRCWYERVPGRLECAADARVPLGQLVGGRLATVWF